MKTVAVFLLLFAFVLACNAFGNHTEFNHTYSGNYTKGEKGERGSIISTVVRVFGSDISNIGDLEHGGNFEGGHFDFDKRKKVAKNKLQSKNSPKNLLKKDVDNRDPVKQAIVILVELDHVNDVTQGEIVYVTNAGYFRVSTIYPPYSQVALTFLFRGPFDSIKIIPGDKLIPSSIRGPRGPRGIDGHSVSLIQATLSDPTQPQVDVLVQSTDAVVVGSVVYAEGAGYYRVTNQAPASRQVIGGLKRYRFVLVGQDYDDNGILKQGQRVVTVGVRGLKGRDGAKGDQGVGVKGDKGSQGIRGEKGATGATGHKGQKGKRGKRGKDGRDGRGFFLDRQEDTVYMIPPAITERAIVEGNLKRVNFNKLRNVYIKESNGEIAPPEKNIDLFSDKIQKITRTCPDGLKIISGSCKWNLVQAKPKKTWCRASDYEVGKRGCTNCVTSVETKDREFNGENTKVVKKLVFNTDQGARELSLGKSSCVMVETRELAEESLKECGYFCLFQKLDPFYENENTFSCRYIPPAAFGAEEIFGKSRSEHLNNKIQSVSVEIVCGIEKN